MNMSFGRIGVVILVLISASIALQACNSGSHPRETIYDLANYLTENGFQGTLSELNGGPFGVSSGKMFSYTGKDVSVELYKLNNDDIKSVKSFMGEAFVLHGNGDYYMLVHDSGGRDIVSTFDNF